MQTFEDIYIYHTGTSFPLEGSEKCKFTNVTSSEF